MTSFQATDDVAVRYAVRQLVRAIERAAAPNGSLCPVDGCLVIGAEECPACRWRTGPRFCECGVRIRLLASNQDATQCSRCRRRPNEREAVPHEDDTRCPMRWVRRGLIWRAVYDQSEVA